MTERAALSFQIESSTRKVRRTATPQMPERVHAF
jgi:hypothetical protein